MDQTPNRRLGYAVCEEKLVHEYNWMVNVSEFKVGLVLSIKDCGSCAKTKGKILKECSIRISPEEENDGENAVITVVTSASNVREGSRVVVAPVGCLVRNEEGEEVTVKRANVGGSISEGILCDSSMLGWSGGAKGVAVQIPDTYPIGSSPPTTKPRMDSATTNSTDDNKSSAVQGLFEKKLTKEEKKKAAEERRRKKKEGISSSKVQTEEDQGIIES